MRKLAPAILMTSMLALAGGAYANTDSGKTDKITGSPTVDANKPGDQNLSYSDKSNTSPGTNAKLDKNKKKKAKANTAMDSSSSTSAEAPMSHPALPSTSAAAPAAPTAPDPVHPATKANAVNSTTGQSAQ